MASKPKAKPGEPVATAAKAAPRPHGRPTAYTEELGAAICYRLCQGETLNSVVGHPDIPMLTQ